MKIAIVGAGSSGLFLSALLSKLPDIEVDVFEKNSKPCVKLKASGGGKANLLNTDIRAKHYNQADFMQSFLKKVNGEEILKIWDDFGLKTRTDEEGRIYPISYFSQTALDVLLNNISDKISIHYNSEVKEITKNSDLWKINLGQKLYDKVILCSGSPAGMIVKNRREYNSYLKSLSVKTKSLQPSLVGFKLNDYPEILNGCRTKAMVRLIQNKNTVFEEKGEVTFKEDGVSGIVILNLSAYYNRLKNKDNCYLSFDFLYPDKIDIEKYFSKYKSLCGLLHPKLNKLFIVDRFDPQDFQLKIKETYDMEFAQVCHGGIQISEIDENLELTRHTNIYAAGEILDIDGVCGGYNLFFAFASAYLIFKQICFKNK